MKTQIILWYIWSTEPGLNEQPVVDLYVNNVPGEQLPNHNVVDVYNRLRDATVV